MRKCRRGWHLDDARGWKGVCSYCILKINHPTLRRIKDVLSNTRLEHRDREVSNMPKQDRGLSMRPKQVIEARLRADYKQAISFLKEDLVWSSDFEDIRLDLMRLIESQVDAAIYAPEGLTDIVQKLISTENDLTI